MSRTIRSLLVVLLIVAAATATGRGEDAAPPPKEAELEGLRRRLEALEAKERARDAAQPQKQGAPGDAPSTPSENKDYRPEVIPFDGFDLTWAPGHFSPKEAVLKWGPFTGEVRADVAYHYSLARPRDDTISGSSEVFRHNEVQVTQLGAGGDFYYKGAHARFLTQLGMYSQTTPRNDSSPNRGQWNLDNAYRYLSEAYAGYHLDVMGGINIQAGIFMSYVGLWSYYNFDNWTYQPSYVSSNTPWFFNGVRVQWYPIKNLKIEPWLVNGWQAYGKFSEGTWNDGWGFGLQVKWAPAEWLIILGNQYYGTDTLNTPGRRRIHTDDSIMVRYWNDPAVFLSRAAASLTVDYGNEDGGGVSYNKQYFVGMMAYHRVWFWENKVGFTIGGGFIKNPGRYLVLLPPVNGATAASGTPSFTANPGDRFTAFDWQATVDFMPVENVIFRVEYTRRVANVNYFAGRGGVTPPGGNQAPAGSAVAGFEPDLRSAENRFTVALMVRF